MSRVDDLIKLRQQRKEIEQAITKLKAPVVFGIRNGFEGRISHYQCSDPSQDGISIEFADMERVEISYSAGKNLLQALKEIYE